MKKFLMLIVLLAPHLVVATLIGCNMSTSPANSVEHDRPVSLPGYNFNSIGGDWHTFNIKVNGREFKMLGHAGYNSLAITTLYEIHSTDPKPPFSGTGK